MAPRIPYPPDAVLRALSPDLADAIGRWVVEIAQGVGPKPEPAPIPSAIVTAEEAVEILRCEHRGVRRIYELIGEGRLTKVGGSRRVRLLRSEVEAMARCSSGSR